MAKDDHTEFISETRQTPDKVYERPVSVTADFGRAEGSRPADFDGPKLTPRERECLQLAARGKSEREISQILGISEHPSEKHLLNDKGKLGAVNRVQAVAEAIRQGLIN